MKLLHVWVFTKQEVRYGVEVVDICYGMPSSGHAEGCVLGALNPCVKESWGTISGLRCDGKWLYRHDDGLLFHPPVVSSNGHKYIVARFYAGRLFRVGATYE